MVRYSVRMVRNTEKILATFKSALEKQGKSERWLHEQSGIPRTTLRGLLSGARPMKLDHYLLIADTLGLDPVRLLGDSTPSVKAAA